MILCGDFIPIHMYYSDVCVCVFCAYVVMAGALYSPRTFGMPSLCVVCTLGIVLYGFCSITVYVYIYAEFNWVDLMK